MSTGECILIVDDNKSIVRMLELVLQHNGYRVVTAYDGFEALEKARVEKPVIVLLDVIMPGIDGYEVCRRLQAQRETSDIRVIFLTSKGRLDLPEVPELKKVMDRNIGERDRGFEAGAIGFISKPVSAKEVLAEVRRVLAIKQLGA
jgi:CheY-like chemotaxis protein